jgi:excinuclease ABC subunit C
MVVAQDGEIKQGEYRIFKIKSMDTPNDPAMLTEVLQRRFADKEFNVWPDILLIDGGKSQLGVVKKAIPENIFILGISKGKRHKRKGGRLLDEFWGMYGDDIQQLDIQNKNILIDLRDEAHRFAILHHRKARSKDSQVSQLDAIPGIGKTRRKLLMTTFGSIEKMKQSSFSQLLEVLGNKKVVEELVKFLKTS